MKKIEEMQFIATIDFDSALFPEDRQTFQKALREAGYLLHQDEETGEFEIYKQRRANKGMKRLGEQSSEGGLICQ